MKYCGFRVSLSLATSIVSGHAAAQGDVLRSWVMPPGTALGTEDGYYYPALAALPDLNRDRIPELLFGDPTFDGPAGMDAGALFVLSGEEVAPGETPIVLRTHHGGRGEHFGFFPSVLGDVDGDGLSDYACSTRIFSGRDGSVLFEHPYRPIRALGDLSGDGLAEFLAAGDVHAGGTFEFLYSTPLYPDRSAALGGDVDGDGTPDFVLAQSDYYCEGGGSLLAFSGASGRTLWGIGPFCSSPLLASGDLNGDGIVDLIEDAWLTRFRDGASGSIFAELARLPSEVSSLEALLETPCGDLDGNGVQDLLKIQTESDGARWEWTLVAVDGATRRVLWRLPGLSYEALVDSGGVDWNDDEFPDFLLADEAADEIYRIELHSGAPARAATATEPRWGVRATGQPCSAAGGAPPRIGVSGPPWIGEKCAVQLSRVEPGLHAFLLVGELAAGPHHGEPCSVLVSPGVTLPAKTYELDPGAGIATATLAIPPLSELIGTIFHAQWVISNPLKPLGSTRALEFQIGFPPDAPTTITGTVQLPDGTPLPDATVELIGQDLLTTTAADGSFLLPEVAIRWNPLKLLAVADIQGRTWSGTVAHVIPLPGQVTEVGELVVSSSNKVLVTGTRKERPAIVDRLLRLWFEEEDVLVTPLPPLLVSAFATVWLAGPEVLSEPSRLRLIDFVNSGGGLHISGFQKELLDELVAGRVEPDSGLPPYCFNPGAIEHVATLPNELGCLKLTYNWGYLGLASPNVLLESSNGVPVGAVWAGQDLMGGTGRLTAIQDWRWMEDPRNPIEVFQNLQIFLEDRAPTSVTGVVQLADGTPVAGAVVLVARQGLETTTAADGSFLLPEVGSGFGVLELLASAERDGLRTCARRLVDPAPGGLVSVTLVLEPSRGHVLLFAGLPGARESLEQDLQALVSAHEGVVSVPDLPASLSAFGVVWHAGAAEALSAEEQGRLVDFVRRGGGLHLTGDEHPSAEALNVSLEELLYRLTSLGVTVGVSGRVPHRFDPDAPGRVTEVPNVLSNWFPAGTRTLLGVPERNVLVRDARGNPCGAVFESHELVGGRGQVTLLMDADWFERIERLPVIENLQRFLERSSADRRLPAPGRTFRR